MNSFEATRNVSILYPADVLSIIIDDSIIAKVDADSSLQDSRSLALISHVMHEYD